MFISDLQYLWFVRQRVQVGATELNRLSCALLCNSHKICFFLRQTKRRTWWAQFSLFFLERDFANTGSWLHSAPTRDPPLPDMASHWQLSYPVYVQRVYKRWVMSVVTGHVLLIIEVGGPGYNCLSCFTHSYLLRKSFFLTAQASIPHTQLYGDPGGGGLHTFWPDTGQG